MFFFFVESWTPLLNQVLDGFVWAGFTAGGSTPAAGASLMKDPSAIINRAFAITAPLEDEIHALNWYDLGPLVLLGWAYIFTILAFFMLAIQVFITYLEFYLVAGLSLILIPFGVFKHTAFMAERALGSVISFGVKLMVLAFIIAAAGPVLSAIALPAAPTMQQAYMVLLAALAIAFLAWHAPGIAGGMIAGGPSLTAGSAAGFATSSLLGIFAGAAAARATGRVIAGGSMEATRAAAEAYGTVSMGARLGSASAQLGGSGVAGQMAGGLAGSAAAASRSAAENAARPFKASAMSVSEAYQRGTLRAWKPSTSISAAGPNAPTGAGGVRDAVHTAQTVRSVIPPESHGGSGMHAPIKPE